MVVMDSAMIVDEGGGGNNYSLVVYSHRYANW